MTESKSFELDRDDISRIVQALREVCQGYKEAMFLNSINKCSYGYMDAEYNLRQTRLLIAKIKKQMEQKSEDKK